MQLPTVALIIRHEQDGAEVRLMETLSDEREIALLETLEKAGDVLSHIRDFRERQRREDEDFGDYVEDLVSKPFVSSEVQQQGLLWLKSKLKIETYEQSERSAVEVIARYAFRVYLEDPTRDDFLLAGPKSQVRVRIFALPNDAIAA